MVQHGALWERMLTALDSRVHRHPDDTGLHRAGDGDEGTTRRHGVESFSVLATEASSESIAHENEIVSHIAREQDFPERPAHDSIEAQLRGLIDPDRIRRH